ncbi:MAG: Gfo/Idh/MocA family oxidoreductase [Candidatus Bathyarchaeota archaeon]|nr:Gfo/Idh/MocA family oxidoreductase [Candidatus Bathyarchaeota archaeon]
MLTDGSRLRVGVIGLGKMGVMHACLLNTFPHVTVAALCDKGTLMRKIAKKAFPNAIITGEIGRFADLDLDAVCVATPIPVHYQIIKEVYGRGIAPNVFAEKTLTSSFRQSLELCALAENSGVNMVGYMKRFAVTFNKAKELLNEHVLGDLVSFEGYAFSSDFSEVPKGSKISEARGGVIEDLGSHVVDLAVWIFGDLTVESATANYRCTPRSEDDVTFYVNGLDGLQGKFEVSWRKSGYRMPEFGLTVHGTMGALHVNDDELRLELSQSPPTRWYRHDMDDNVRFLLGGPEYYRETMHFFNSIASGAHTISDFRSALKVDFLLEQVREKCR